MHLMKSFSLYSHLLLKEGFKKGFFLQIEKMRTELENETAQKRETLENELKLQYQKVQL